MKENGGSINIEHASRRENCGKNGYTEENI